MDMGRSRTLELFFLLLFLNAFVEGVCEYETQEDHLIVMRPETVYTETLQGIHTLESCGQSCCTNEKCSSAMYKENICIVVDCSQVHNCNYTKAESSGVTLITLKKPEAAGEGENSLEQHTTSTLAIFQSPTPTHRMENSTFVTPKNSVNAEIHQNLSAESSDSDPAVEEIEAISTIGHITETTAFIRTTVATIPEETVPERLAVYIHGNQEIQLPKDSVTIHADVAPVSAGGEYEYQWRLLKHPDDDNGVQSGIETPALKLVSLSVGIYQFKVEVRGENMYGEAYTNITVLPKPRVNTKPVAIISPSLQELTLPTDSTLLDGSKSHDDDGIVKYEWEELQGPLQANLNKNINGDLPNEKVLKITGLTTGNYTFKLTVTDTDKMIDSTQATIIVKKKIDNPPIANAGSNQVIHLPQNSAIVCGNDSTDDWGIVNYKWSLCPDSKNEVVDMQGAHSPCLELSDLEVGDYTFQLSVSDEAGQEDRAKVTIIVQPESNHPPIANAGGDKQFLLPLSGGAVTFNLDGSQSKDDKAITTILWTMTSGPEKGNIVDDGELVTSVTGISKEGKYTFMLKVTDEDGASSTDSVVITVKDEQPPVAQAGPDLFLTLPDNVAMLYGSKSTDDYGILEYEWTRSDESPAAGYVLNHSDHLPVLHVAGLVEGLYTFTLKVTNVRGKVSVDDARITVLPDPWEENLVELHLAANIHEFAEARRQTIVKELELLLSLQSGLKVEMRSVHEEHHTGHVVLLFYVKSDGDSVLPAAQVADSLTSKLEADAEFMKSSFIRANTYVCENTCSGHGQCLSGSHKCECEMFWMESFLRVLLGDGKRNCDWSVLYVGIISFILIGIISCLSWFFTCSTLRKRRSRMPPKHHNDTERARYQKLAMKGNINSHTLKDGCARQAAIYKSSAMMGSISSTASLSDFDWQEENTVSERELLVSSNITKEAGRSLADSDTSAGEKVKPSTSTSMKVMHHNGVVNGGFNHQSIGKFWRGGNMNEEDVL